MKNNNKIHSKILTKISFLKDLIQIIRLINKTKNQ